MEQENITEVNKSKNKLMEVIIRKYIIMKNMTNLRERFLPDLTVSISDYQKIYCKTIGSSAITHVSVILVRYNAIDELGNSNSFPSQRLYLL